MRRVIGAAPALLAAAAALLYFGVHPHTTSATAKPEAVKELRSFEAKLTPLVQSGGQVVEQSMKPALDDLRYDHVTPASFMAKEAQGWVLSLTQVRRDVLALKATRDLAQVRDTLAASLDKYVQAARTFRAAILASGADREALLSTGLSQARAADLVYDRGSQQLQVIRHRLGLEPSPYFPAGGHE